MLRPVRASSPCLMVSSSASRMTVFASLASMVPTPVGQGAGEGVVVELLEGPGNVPDVVEYEGGRLRGERAS